MRMTGEELIRCFPDHRRGAAHIKDIKKVSTDSRQMMDEGLFVPIVGERFDGHDFVLQAVEQGAVAALWQTDREVPSKIPSDFPLFFVNDTLKGLQNLAVSYLQKVSPVVIGITGSNGKTTTKDMVESVLARRFRTHKTEGNFNNHIGLPLTILRMPETSEVLILEMGMNHFGEISFLSKLSQPDFGIITNIGESHIEYLGDRAGIAKAKMELTDGLKENGRMIFDGDEPLLHKLHTDKGISCGYGQQNRIQIESVKMDPKGLTFKIRDQKESFRIPLIGKHNAKNAACAIAVGRELGMEDSEIRKGLSDLSMTGMRLQQVRGKNGALIINDAYNASPTSMRAAIETVRDFEDYREKIVVLGDIYELGEDERALHESVASEIKPPLTHLITVGPKAKWIAGAVKEESRDHLYIESFDTKEDAAALLERYLSTNTVILVKASRALGLESIVEKLSG